MFIQLLTLLKPFQQGRLRATRLGGDQFSAKTQTFYRFSFAIGNNCVYLHRVYRKRKEI